MAKQRIPARATLDRWAQERIQGGCTHDRKCVLHHDHLIDEARNWLRKALLNTGEKTFAQVWPAFLETHRSLFHDPAYVCATCNEQDAALKGPPGSVAAIIPSGMSLSATDLNRLANEKIRMRRFGKRKAAEAVREAFRPLAPQAIEAFNARTRELRAAVDSYRDSLLSPANARDFAARN